VTAALELRKKTVAYNGKDRRKKIADGMNTNEQLIDGVFKKT